jgi:hypothetical protein
MSQTDSVNLAVVLLCNMNFNLSNSVQESVVSQPVGIGLLFLTILGGLVIAAIAKDNIIRIGYVLVAVSFIAALRVIQGD